MPSDTTLPVLSDLPLIESIERASRPAQIMHQISDPAAQIRPTGHRTLDRSGCAQIPAHSRYVDFSHMLFDARAKIAQTTRLHVARMRNDPERRVNFATHSLPAREIFATTTCYHWTKTIDLSHHIAKWTTYRGRIKNDASGTAKNITPAGCNEAKGER